jgi:large subunit ribosomal protein L22
MARQIAPDAQEAIATAKFIRMSPTKVRQVVDLIRGRHVDDARRVLRFTRRAASAPVLKVLDSAVANAEHNRALPGDELIIVRTWVDEGPTLRRFRPRALGRATRIRKRTCHVSVVVGRPPEADLYPVERRGADAGDEGQPRKKTTRKKTTRKTTTRKSAPAESTEKKSTAKRTTRATEKKTTARTSTPKKPTARPAGKAKDEEEG